MFEHIRTRWARFGRDESGIALVTVMGIIALMTLIAVTGFVLARQSLQQTVRVTAETQAFQAASAGVDAALARIQKNGFRVSDYPVTTTTVGASFVSTVAPTSNSEYICTSTGRDANGATVTIRVKFFYLNMWNMNLASGTNNALGGGSTRGTTSVYGPFYVRGGVELGSNSRVEGGPLFIKGGGLKLTGSGALGENTAGGIDLYVTGAYPTPGSKGMFTRSVSQSVPDISLPVIDQAFMHSMYLQARNESIDNCQGYVARGIANLECSSSDANTYQTVNPPNSGGWQRNKAADASSFYKVVGTDAGESAIGAGTHGLTIGGLGSFGSWSGDGHYTLATKHDDFAFDDVNNILYVEGTVFVDGPLTLNEDIHYAGNGSIVCNGPITIKRDFRPNTSATSTRTAGWPDATHVVGLVTPVDIFCNAGDNNLKDPNAIPNVAGAFFTSRTWVMDDNNNVVVKGSVLAGAITFGHANQHLVTDQDLPGYLPESMPGAGQAILTKGAWVR